MKHISPGILVLAVVIFSCSGEATAQLEPYGLEGEEITSLSISSQDYYQGHYFLCAGTRCGGVHVRELDSPDSQWVNLGLENKHISSVYVYHWGVGPGDLATIFAGICPSDVPDDSISLYRLTYDSDTTWVPIDNRGDVIDRFGICAINGFFYSGHSPPQPIFIVIWDWVYRSYDWESWEEVHYGGGWVMETHQAWDPWTSWAIWIGGSTDFDTPYLVKSLDRGETWEHCSPGADALGKCTALAIDPHDTDIVYIATSCGWVMKTANGGETWRRLPLYINAFGLAIDAVNPSHLVAGGSPGGHFAIYESYDAGESWAEVAIDTALSPIISCAADTLKGEFITYLGTAGDGVYRYRSHSTKVTDAGDEITLHDFTLHQNYPNPFNTSTIIDYHLPHCGHVSLKIFNILGQEVFALVDDDQPAGPHSITWDAKDFASGIYFYQLKLNHRLQKTEKLVLLR